MFSLIKKDLLTLSKSKNELIELLLTPLLLLSILGFALGGLMNNTEVELETAEFGLITHQNLQDSLDRFESDLREAGMPEETVQGLLSAATAMDPAEQLNRMFESEEIREMINIQPYESINEAEAAAADDEIGGFIEIPEYFSYSVWQSLFLEEETTAELEVTVQDPSQIRAVVLDTILSSFIEEYNLQASVAIATEGEAQIAAADNQDYGEIQRFSTEEPINSFQYYTIGMGVFYALSVAGSVALRAYKEKEQHVFARIMLSNQSPMAYLFSKMVSGTLITYLQLLILFVLSTVFFGTFSGKGLDFWMNTLLITLLYSLVVGSVTSLLTSLSLRSSSDATVGFFSSFIAVLAFLGGSFTPVETFSELIKEVGNWTPNGAALSSYLQIMMGFDLAEIAPLLVRMIGMSLVMLISAVLLFPKRRLN